MASLWRRYDVIILALAGIAAVSIAGLYARGQPLDIRIFREVNSALAGPALDALAYLGYALGTFWFSLALYVALFIAGERRFALSALGALVAGGLLVQLIKYLSLELRPWQMLAGVRFMGIRSTGPSFPSGHAEQAFLTSYLLIAYFMFRWYVQAALYGTATMVGFTRIYVGDHLPADVVAGALIGILVAVLWVHTPLWPGPRRQAAGGGG